REVAGQRRDHADLDGLLLLLAAAAAALAAAAGDDQEQRSEHGDRLKDSALQGHGSSSCREPRWFWRRRRPGLPLETLDRLAIPATVRGTSHPGFGPGRDRQDSTATRAERHYGPARRQAGCSRRPERRSGRPPRAARG